MIPKLTNTKNEKERDPILSLSQHDKIVNLTAFNRPLKFEPVFNRTKYLIGRV